MEGTAGNEPQGNVYAWKRAVKIQGESGNLEPQEHKKYTTNYSRGERKDTGIEESLSTSEVLTHGSELKRESQCREGNN